MAWIDDQARPTGPPPSDDTIVGISRHHAPPLASPCPSARFLPINIFWEDARSWESLPLAYPGGRTTHIPSVYFI